MWQHENTEDYLDPILWSTCVKGCGIKMIHKARLLIWFDFYYGTDNQLQ